MEAAVPPREISPLFGDHELIKEIAPGGARVVFKVKQVSLNRIVAVNVIRSEWLASAANAVVTSGSPGLVHMASPWVD